MHDQEPSCLTTCRNKFSTDAALGSVETLKYSLLTLKTLSLKPMQVSKSHFCAYSQLTTVRKDKKSDIADWRVRTLSLAQRIGCQNSKPQRTADSIYETLRPLLLPKSKNPSTNELDMQKRKVQILEICKKAYALTIKMRQSKSTYQIVGIERGDKFNGYDETPSFTPQETSVPKDKLVNLRVSFTIFGALVKVPDGVSAGERHVLEKAHVVCQ
jgi:hypothetical protein